MNPSIAALAGVVLLAATHALPIGSGLGSGLTLGNEMSLNNRYNADLRVGNIPVRIGLSWAKGGGIGAGVLAVPEVNGQLVPVGAAIETNINDPGKDIKYQVGAQVDTVGAIVSGDLKGELRYGVNAWVPIEGSSEISAVGLGIEGDKLKPVAVSGGVLVGGEAINARVGLDSDYKPNNVNILIGA